VKELKFSPTLQTYEQITNNQEPRTKMCDEWMPVLQLPLTIAQFHQLPRNPAYKYEYIQGKAVLSPRAKHYHASLDLGTFIEEKSTAIDRMEIRAVQDEDWPELEDIFQGAFGFLQPFGSLDDETLAKAARECLRRTRTGGDGPWIEPASFVAVDKTQGQVVGVILLTLLPGDDPSDWDSFYWGEAPPPPDLLVRRAGQPHLTWIFISRMKFGNGIGSLLLAKSVSALHGLGYGELWSTFVSGNDSSMLWHWRNGFRLLPNPASRRRRNSGQ
jgi:L-amino acid N-acyltransferase YncA